jgi:hypothetical protein
MESDPIIPRSIFAMAYFRGSNRATLSTGDGDEWNPRNAAPLKIRGSIAPPVATICTCKNVNRNSERGDEARVNRATFSTEPGDEHAGDDALGILDPSMLVDMHAAVLMESDGLE